MINVIVASHGPLADALLASSRMVYGELPHVFTVTLSDQAGIEGFKQDFATTLKNAGHNADGVLVLCDMQSGTPWNVACQHAFSAETTPPLAVVAGVNFPMLLQSEDVSHFTDVHAAAEQLLEMTVPTLIKAVPVLSVQSDDF
ncbi:PTS system mannose-specific IIA component [Klebsiella oxytoca]|uniref:PTS system mannose-specific IIA component n=1 Tax=Klebsiella oxytoca TaxID=571 RepID=A0A318G1I5_KLEOX|nr:PTS fructose transporter subunit IIA [Klebsiella oxytoca]PXW48611.1 PTS system mannose-specific IIA component [Klebsiella oxytoca]HCB1497448.1 PTS fructose transporter subunit IIA [Klebsiella michiganensis]HCB1844645.1 PTS fructose transporter subunit IIA [Klebsiella oxytoca]